MASKNNTSNILVAIVNYNFSDNADFLKKKFQNKFPTIIIDSSSKTHPNGVDFIIENQYYTGQWNCAVNKAIDNGYDWLFFIASDLTFIIDQDIDIIIKDIIANNSIGIYTPSVDKESRCSFTDLFNQNTNNIRYTNLVEGFCFLARTQILKHMYPVNYSQNKYGWCLDTTMCDICTKKRYKIVVDDRIVIHHPQSLTSIDRNLASIQCNEYRGLFAGKTYE